MPGHRRAPHMQGRGHDPGELPVPRPARRPPAAVKLRRPVPHTNAAEGRYPERGDERRPVYVIAEPWPGIPIRKGTGGALEARARRTVRDGSQVRGPAAQRGSHRPRSSHGPGNRRSSRTGDQRVEHLSTPPQGSPPASRGASYATRSCLVGDTGIEPVTSSV
jgi:hypothetical protein